MLHKDLNLKKGTFKANHMNIWAYARTMVISQDNKKSKHKHQYEECLIRYKWNWEENKIHTSLNSYCTICGKINDKMKNSIVIDYMKKVDTPVGKRYIQISEDILYDTYHGRLPVFFVEDICKDKYVNLG